MAVVPVVLALSRSGEPVAHKIAALLGAKVHGREGRVDTADAFFANALDHARDLFAAGVPIVGVCASGILIRAVAPLLMDKTTEPPVVSVSDDGAVVVPLLGGHDGEFAIGHGRYRHRQGAMVGRFAKRGRLAHFLRHQSSRRFR